MYRMLQCARELQMQLRNQCIGVVTTGFHTRIARISPTSGEISLVGLSRNFRAFLSSIGTIVAYREILD